MKIALLGLILLSYNLVAQTDKNQQNTSKSYIFYYYAAGNWGNSASLHQREKLSTATIQNRNGNYVIRSQNFIINVTSAEPEETSKYPDIYDKSFKYSGNIVVFSNAETKEMLGITAKEYADVKGRVYTDFSGNLYGISFHYINKELKTQRAICFSRTAELMDHSFKSMSKFLNKSYDMKDINKK